MLMGVEVAQVALLALAGRAAKIDGAAYPGTAIDIVAVGARTGLPVRNSAVDLRAASKGSGGGTVAALTIIGRASRVLGGQDACGMVVLMA